MTTETFDMSKLKNLCREREGYINIDPLQTGGDCIPTAKLPCKTGATATGCEDFCGGRLTNKIPADL